MQVERTFDTPAMRMHRLLVQSLIAWKAIGKADLLDPTTVRINGLGRTIDVVAQEPGLPFRWMVIVDSRARPALSVSAVLKQVRAVLDPAHRPSRARAAMHFGASSD